MLYISFCLFKEIPMASKGFKVWSYYLRWTNYAKVKACNLFFPPSLPDIHLSQLLLAVMVRNLSVVVRELGVGLSDTVIF